MKITSRVRDWLRRPKRHLVKAISEGPLREFVYLDEVSVRDRRDVNRVVGGGTCAHLEGGGTTGRPGQKARYLKKTGLADSLETGWTGGGW